MIASISQGEWVWVQPKIVGEFEIPYGAKVIRTDPGKVLVKDDSGREEWVDTQRILRAMHVTSQEGVEDMITLGDLHEHAILRNLCIRYKEDQIYVSSLSVINHGDSPTYLIYGQ